MTFLVFPYKILRKGVFKYCLYCGDIVAYLIEQVARYFTRYICLDSWFHSLDVIEFLSQFSFVIGANGKIVNGENGFYVSRSERKRLVVRGRGGRATNLDLPRDDVFRVYDEVRTPI